MILAVLLAAATFSHDVAPILYRNCAGCHRAGGVAPFPLIPAEGPDLYQCFAIPDPSARARYLRAVDIQPGNPKTVHHALLFQDTTGTARKRDTGQAIGINPHAHYLCKEMYGYAVLPDGKRVTLIRIPQWDFNWQQQYLYAAPPRFPAETRVEMEFTYDNSADNPRNPHQPPERVRYGPGSTDEMAGLHITVVPVRESDAEELSQTLWGKMIRAMGPRR